MREKFHRTQFFYQGTAVGFKADEIILPNGKKAFREYLTHPGAVAIVPFLDSPDRIPLMDCRVVMVEQYRYPVDEITVELPAGKIDPNESPRSCLARELKEETGFSTAKFTPLLSYQPTPAFSQEIIHIFWADRLKKGRSNPDEDEFLRTKIEKFGALLRKVQTGKIRDSKTVIGLLACAVKWQVNK